MKFQLFLVLTAAATAVAANGATIVNQGDFQVPVLAGTGGSYGPVAGSAWLFNGATGIANPGPNSPWAPFSQDGTGQVAFIQQQNIFANSPSGGDFSQMLTGLLTTQSYTLTFYAADRFWADGVNAYFSPDNFSVSLGTNTLTPVGATPSAGNIIPPAGTGNNPAAFAYTMYTYTFTPTAATALLDFKSVSTIPSNAVCQANFPANCVDLDTVVSNVSVVANAPPPSVPEPSTFALLIPALGGLAFSVRRRYKTQS